MRKLRPREEYVEDVIKLTTYDSSCFAISDAAPMAVASLVFCDDDRGGDPWDDP